MLISAKLNVGVLSPYNERVCVCVPPGIFPSQVSKTIRNQRIVAINILAYAKVLYTGTYFKYAIEKLTILRF